MLKSKLQELCQKKGWSLPDYNSTKQGHDHNPRFEASVTVNGLSFQSRFPARSSKEAQNDAAHVAFLHFSGTSTQDINSMQVERQEASQSSPMVETASVVKDDQHLSKNLLQNFTQKRNLNLPVYSCEYEGPPNVRRFKCKVTVDGQTFESSEFFPTVKDAEHAAAKIALTSLSPARSFEIDSSFFKNLLQELAQKESYQLPIYTTTRSGEAHAPTFVSRVEVDGEIFMGPEAKTKKQAEIFAARIAFTTLKERKSKRISTVITPSHDGREMSILPSGGTTTNVSTDLQMKIRPQCHLPSNVSSTLQGSTDRDTVNDRVINPNLSSPFPQPDMADMDSMSSLSETKVHQPAVQCTPLSSDSKTDFITNSSPKMPVSSNTFSGNRVVVCPREQNMTFPAGCTVLPMSDDNWVARKCDSQAAQ